MSLILFNKPFGVLSQFTSKADQPTLASYLQAPGARVAGRLDFDSEGLLLLTDHGALQARITEPKSHWPKTYWAQVEGRPADAALDRLREGLKLADGPTRPAVVTRLEREPEGLWPRTPPIRFRAKIPTTWLQLSITEGRHRQVRRMTAAIGAPTLRLVRSQVGPWTLDGLQPGESRSLETATAWADVDRWSSRR